MCVLHRLTMKLFWGHNFQPDSQAWYWLTNIFPLKLRLKTTAHLNLIYPPQLPSHINYIRLKPWWTFVRSWLVWRHDSYVHIKTLTLWCAGLLRRTGWSFNNETDLCRNFNDWDRFIYRHAEQNGENIETMTAEKCWFFIQTIFSRSTSVHHGTKIYEWNLICLGVSDSWKIGDPSYGIIGWVSNIGAVSE